MSPTKIIIAASLLIAGIIFSFSFISFDGVTGNGNVITKERAVTSFSQLKLDGVFNVFVSQGGKESVKVETDENLQDHIEVVQEGNLVTVKSKEKPSVKATKMNVYITITTLDQMAVNGVGNVTSTTPIKGDKFKLSFNGVGNTELEVNYKDFHAQIEGVGNIKLKGSADAADIAATGTGNLKAFDLAAKKLNVNVSGVGNAEVRADEEISINSSGIGNLSYTGNATVKSKNVSGIGKVKKV